MIKHLIVTFISLTPPKYATELTCRILSVKYRRIEIHWNPIKKFKKIKHG